ncbi:transcriptional regulator, AsnC family protein [Roseovarius sp. 217]|nr:transcriptional regulator, AsnC family protein [Roseovarius sp. 217]
MKFGNFCAIIHKLTIDKNIMFDDTDRRILRQYQHAPTLGPAELAERSGVAPATCTRRLERMQEEGILRANRAVIDWRALGYEVEVSLRITLDKTQPRAFDEFMAAARNVPEVLEIQTFLGRVDLRLSIIARDMGHYQQLYRSAILTLPHIADIEALMHVARIKSDEVLPL